MKTNGNDPAFACASDNGHQQGMSIRAYFAAMVMQGLRASKLIAQGADGYHQKSNTIWSSERMAELAVQDADALIEELNKEK